MDTIVDTQILSYCFKGVGHAACNQSLAITSITAVEFLLAQPKSSHQPQYYIIHPTRYLHRLSTPVNSLTTEEGGLKFSDHFENPKWAKAGANRTDHVIIDFGSQFPAYREFGNEAISEIINEKHFQIYRASILHLPKQRQKYLKKRLEYILDNNCYCYSLTRSAIEIALDLFLEFITKNNCKGNIRNTVNDILILATAIDRGKKFLTHDNLLNRFASDYYDAPIHEDNNELLIDFECKAIEKKKNRESKGYINKGWSYCIRNNRTVEK